MAIEASSSSTPSLAIDGKQYPVDERFGTWRAAGYEYVDRQHRCSAACGRVALTRSALCKSRIISKPKVAPAPKTAKKK